MTKETHYFEAVIFEGKEGENEERRRERESNRNRSRNRGGKAGKGMVEKQF